jgi:hypothetical protein
MRGAQAANKKQSSEALFGAPAKGEMRRPHAYSLGEPRCARTRAATPRLRVLGRRAPLAVCPAGTEQGRTAPLQRPLACVGPARAHLVVAHEVREALLVFPKHGVEEGARREGDPVGLALERRHDLGGGGGQRGWARGRAGRRDWAALALGGGTWVVSKCLMCILWCDASNTHQPALPSKPFICTREESSNLAASTTSNGSIMCTSAAPAAAPVGASAAARPQQTLGWQCPWFTAE